MSANLVADMERAERLVARRGLDRRLALQIGLCGAEAREAALVSLESATASQIAALNATYAATLAAQVDELRTTVRALVWQTVGDVVHLARKLVPRNRRQRRG